MPARICGMQLVDGDDGVNVAADRVSDLPLQAGEAEPTELRADTARRSKNHSTHFGPVSNTSGPN